MSVGRMFKSNLTLSHHHAYATHDEHQIYSFKQMKMRPRREREKEKARKEREQWNRRDTKQPTNLFFLSARPVLSLHEKYEEEKKKENRQRHWPALMSKIDLRKNDLLFICEQNICFLTISSHYSEFNFFFDIWSMFHYLFIITQ